MSVAHRFKDKERTNDVRTTESVDFAGLLLSAPVLEGLHKAGFEVPSPIQLKAIPLGRCGLDLIVQAKSGTGKTCVFTVVALESIEMSPACVQVLVLAPTREIAQQIQSVVNSIGAAMPDLKCHTFIGGMPVLQDKVTAKNCHIAVGTPGRVKQLIEIGALKTSSIRLFVMDEADKLLEEGSFQEDINWIYSSLPASKQILALSATYPEVLAQQLRTYMRNPTFVRLNITDPALIGIKQFHVVVPDHPLVHKVLEAKTESILRILNTVSFQQCLIFSNMQTRAQTLKSELVARGWPTSCIAGCLTQTERTQAMEELKTYRVRVLISTDLTSRGIDADKVNLVINLDVPFDHETYLHRIGRAGRFGSYGAAITIVSAGGQDKELWGVERKCKTYIHKLPEPIPRDLATRSLKVNLDDVVSTERIITRPETQLDDGWLSPGKSGGDRLPNGETCDERNTVVNGRVHTNGKESYFDQISNREFETNCPGMPQTLGKSKDVNEGLGQDLENNKSISNGIDRAEGEDKGKLGFGSIVGGKVNDEKEELKQLQEAIKQLDEQILLKKEAKKSKIEKPVGKIENVINGKQEKVEKSAQGVPCGVNSKLGLENKKRYFYTKCELLKLNGVNDVAQANAIDALQLSSSEQTEEEKSLGGNKMQQLKSLISKNNESGREQEEKAEEKSELRKEDVCQNLNPLLEQVSKNDTVHSDMGRNHVELNFDKFCDKHSAKENQAESLAEKSHSCCQEQLHIVEEKDRPLERCCHDAHSNCSCQRCQEVTKVINSAALVMESSQQDKEEFYARIIANSTESPNPADSTDASDFVSFSDALSKDILAKAVITAERLKQVNTKALLTIGSKPKPEPISSIKSLSDSSIMQIVEPDSSALIEQEPFTGSKPKPEHKMSSIKSYLDSMMNNLVIEPSSAKKGISSKDEPAAQNISVIDHPAVKSKSTSEIELEKQERRERREHRVKTRPFALSNFLKELNDDTLHPMDVAEELRENVAYDKEYRLKYVEAPLQNGHAKHKSILLSKKDISFSPDVKHDEQVANNILPNINDDDNLQITEDHSLSNGHIINTSKTIKSNITLLHGIEDLAHCKSKERLGNIEVLDAVNDEKCVNGLVLESEGCEEESNKNLSSQNLHNSTSESNQSVNYVLTLNNSAPTTDQHHIPKTQLSETPDSLNHLSLRSNNQSTTPTVQLSSAAETQMKKSISQAFPVCLSDEKFTQSDRFELMLKLNSLFLHGVPKKHQTLSAIRQDEKQFSKMKEGERVIQEKHLLELMKNGTKNSLEDNVLESKFERLIEQNHKLVLQKEAQWLEKLDSMEEVVFPQEREPGTPLKDIADENSTQQSRKDSGSDFSASKREKKTAKRKSRPSDTSNWRKPVEDRRLDNSHKESKSQVVPEHESPIRTVDTMKRKNVRVDDTKKTIVDDEKKEQENPIVDNENEEQGENNEEGDTEAKQDFHKKVNELYENILGDGGKERVKSKDRDKAKEDEWLMLDDMHARMLQRRKQRKGKTSEGMTTKAEMEGTSGLITALNGLSTNSTSSRVLQQPTSCENAEIQEQNIEVLRLGKENVAGQDEESLPGRSFSRSKINDKRGKLELLQKTNSRPEKVIIHKQGSSKTDILVDDPSSIMQKAKPVADTKTHHISIAEKLKNSVRTQMNEQVTENSQKRSPQNPETNFSRNNMFSMPAVPCKPTKSAARLAGIEVSEGSTSGNSGSSTSEDDSGASSTHSEESFNSSQNLSEVYSHHTSKKTSSGHHQHSSHQPTSQRNKHNSVESAHKTTTTQRNSAKSTALPSLSKSKITSKQDSLSRTSTTKTKDQTRSRRRKEQFVSERVSSSSSHSSSSSTEDTSSSSEEEGPTESLYHQQYYSSVHQSLHHHPHHYNHPGVHPYNGAALYSHMPCPPNPHVPLQQHYQYHPMYNQQLQAVHPYQNQSNMHPYINPSHPYMAYNMQTSQYNPHQASMLPSPVYPGSYPHHQAYQTPVPHPSWGQPHSSSHMASGHMASPSHVTSQHQMQYVTAMTKALKKLNKAHSPKKTKRK